MTPRLATWLVGVSLVIAVGGAAGATSSGGWVGHTTGLVPHGSSDVHVAAADGVAIAVWTEHPQIKVSFRGRDHRWAAPATLGEGSDPRVAMDREGNSLVTITQAADKEWRIVSFARDAASGVWTGAVPVSDPECDTGGEDMAMNDRGEAVAAWASCEAGLGSLGVVRAAMRRRDGTWERPLNLGYGAEVDVAVDAGGNAVAVWSRTGIYAESRVGGRWENAVVLSTQRAEGSPRVVMNRRGDALAIWGESPPTGLALMSSFRRANTSTWTSPSLVPVSEPGNAIFYFYGVSFALDERGNAILATHRDDGTVEVTTRAFGADSWDRPSAIGNSGSGPWYATDTWCVGPRVVVDRDGDAVVLWGGAALQSARRVGPQWLRPVVVSAFPACFQRDLAIDAGGNAVAVWNAGPGAASRVDAAVLDVSAPTLERLTVPASARAGRATRLSVRVSDVWSSLARPPLWEFGDGKRARGASVRHVFRRPGRYRITVTATDEAGNTATAGAVVRVVR